MKIKSQVIVNIGEVTRHGNLRLDALFNILQEKAILHTHKVGLEIKDMLEAQKIWVLNRVAVEISELPRLEESIEVFTWSRKIHRFKGMRDFEIFAGEKSIIRAASLWVYFDAEKGRPVRVPDSLEEKYGAVNDQAVADDIETMQFSSIADADFSLPIATRISDYDINGHVNNAALLQYIETGIYRAAPEDSMIERIQLVFQREVPFDISQIDVCIQRVADSCLFELRNEETVYVKGSAYLKSPVFRAE